MTGNQIAFWKYQEEARANKAREALGSTANDIAQQQANASTTQSIAGFGNMLGSLMGMVIRAIIKK